MHEPSQWDRHLSHPPQILQMGLTMHGSVRVRRYRMIDAWSLNLCDYHGAVCFGRDDHEIRPGTAILMPPGTEREFRFRGLSPHRFAHFVLPPCPDQDLPAPAVIDHSRSRARLFAQFDEAMVSRSTAPARAAAALWDLLWRALEPPLEAPTSATAGHPAVARAVKHIEENLSTSLRVDRIARQAGVSHNQLTRLFNATFGNTVAAFIRGRRVDRAVHLARTTDLPLKAIAHEVGMPDLQAFNKVIRRETGKSPRSLREVPLPTAPPLL